MIFASDLDRTLVFAERFLTDNQTLSLKVVEETNNKKFYMTEESYSLLKKITDNIVFMPVTTRTEEEYKRIFAFHDLDIPIYITDNGGTIVVNGKVDMEWKQHIQQAITKQSKNKSEVLDVFLTLFPKELFRTQRLASELFWVNILEDEFEDIDIENYRETIDSLGWKMEKTGRKIYLIPNGMTKEAALTYIMKKHKNEKIIAAGDSNMDLEMVKISQLGYIPKHGEVAQHTHPSHVIVTKEEGILAGEEILRKVWNEINLKK